MERKSDLIKRPERRELQQKRKSEMGGYKKGWNERIRKKNVKREEESLHTRTHTCMYVYTCARAYTHTYTQILHREYDTE